MAVKRKNGFGGTSYYRNSKNKEAYAMQAKQRQATTSRLQRQIRHLRAVDLRGEYTAARRYYTDCLLDVRAAISI